jgi:hypothetical protein
MNKPLYFDFQGTLISFHQIAAVQQVFPALDSGAVSGYYLKVQLNGGAALSFFYKHKYLAVLMRSRLVKLLRETVTQIATNDEARIPYGVEIVPDAPEELLQMEEAARHQFQQGDSKAMWELHQQIGGK